LLGQLLHAWEEFADLEATPAGVALMLETARAYRNVNDDEQVLVWLERLLPVAERLDLLEKTASALARLSSTLFRLQRPREALILLRGTHELAMANELEEVHRGTRTILTFYEQFANPAAGLAMGREGLDIASRLGSAAYGFVMVGNAVSCAIRVGEWAWASALLDVWLANEITGEFYLELFVDRAVLNSLTGGDASADIGEAERLLPAMNDPQYQSYCHWARAWAALIGGRLADARKEALAAGQAANYFVPITYPLAARAALWAGDVADAAVIVGELDASVRRGEAIGLDRVTLRAGIAAREGRRTDAIAGYRDALRGWRALGCAFDEALAALDMGMLLAPTEREMAEAPAALEAARETFSRLGARPFLERLDAVRPGSPAEVTPRPTVEGRASDEAILRI
jgi:hypothetical protein